MKTMLTGTFLPLGASIRKEERLTIHNLSSCLRNLQKEEQFKAKASRRKEIIKRKAEINELGNRKSTEKINESKSWLFEKVNKIKGQGRGHRCSGHITYICLYRLYILIIHTFKYLLYITHIVYFTK